MESAVEAPQWIKALQSLFSGLFGEIGQTFLWLNHLFHSLTGFNLVMVPVFLFILYLAVWGISWTIYMVLWCFQHPREFGYRLWRAARSIVATAFILACLLAPVLFTVDYPYNLMLLLFGWLVGPMLIAWIAGKDVKRERELLRVRPLKQ